MDAHAYGVVDGDVNAGEGGGANSVVGDGVVVLLKI